MLIPPDILCAVLICREQQGIFEQKQHKYFYLEEFDLPKNNPNRSAQV